MSDIVQGQKTRQGFNYLILTPRFSSVFLLQESTIFWKYMTCPREWKIMNRKNNKKDLIKAGARIKCWTVLRAPQETFRSPQYFLPRSQPTILWIQCKAQSLNFAFIKTRALLLMRTRTLLYRPRRRRFYVPLYPKTLFLFCIWFLYELRGGNYENRYLVIMCFSCVQILF